MHFLSSIGEPGIWETICRQTALLTTSSSNILNPASWDFNSQNLVFRLDSISQTEVSLCSGTNL